MQNDVTGRMRRGASCSLEPRAAVGELYDAIGGDDIELAVLFIASAYDRDALASAIRERFGATTVIGCTTAGEIGPDGYTENTLAGFSLESCDFRAVTKRIDSLATFTMQDGIDAAASLARTIGADVQSGGTFGVLMADGLSCKEELLISSLYRGLGSGAIPIVGGSAGDGLAFDSTWILHEGEFHADAAILTLVTTERPFEIIRTAHFERSEHRVVVTDADPARRIVREINGGPAAEEYARILGFDPAAMTPHTFSANPVVVRAGGVDYVRSIQKVNDDGSLTFFCAIDEGIVLRLANAVDIVSDLERAFDRVRERIGQPELTLGFDCVLRKLELRQRGLVGRAGAIMVANNVAGFSTYGEQTDAMHVNQTFTGVAIGGAK